MGSSKLTFAATETVHSDPAGHKHKPRANLGLCKLQSKQGLLTWEPCRGKNEFTGGTDEVTDLGEKKKNTCVT